jgi:hypothetical protein
LGYFVGVCALKKMRKIATPPAREAEDGENCVAREVHCGRSWSRGRIKKLIDAVHCFEGNGLVDLAQTKKTQTASKFLMLKAVGCEG